MQPRYLFAYGTLRQGFCSPLSRLLAKHAEHISNATYQGKLYLVAEYPGAVPSNNTEDKVQGDVYVIKQASLLLPRLDAYEECNNTLSQAAEYERKIQTVTLAAGQSLSAWVYLYNRPTKGLMRIVSGDFLSFSASQHKA